MKRAWIPVIIFLVLATLLIVDLTTKTGIECRVCVTFEGRQKCASARAEEKREAATEAQSSACSLLTSGVSQAVKCPRVEPDSVVCK
ncbi:MAG: hypothetical protein SF187_03235 [Deltaproteobacteria bacterium]|nr:hypothetical protein [Deltaproteobacteria bacterium]